MNDLAFFIGCLLKYKFNHKLTTKLFHSRVQWPTSIPATLNQHLDSVVPTMLTVAMC